MVLESFVCDSCHNEGQTARELYQGAHGGRYLPSLSATIDVVVSLQKERPKSIKDNQRDPHQMGNARIALVCNSRRNSTH